MAQEEVRIHETDFVNRALSIWLRFPGSPTAQTVTSSTSAQWFISEQHPKAIDAQSERKVFVIPTAQLPHERLHCLKSR